jgi:hypothetical protein
MWLPGSIKAHNCDIYNLQSTPRLEIVRIPDTPFPPPSRQHFPHAAYWHMIWNNVTNEASSTFTIIHILLGEIQ